jgi:hypothetical protein
MKMSTRALVVTLALGAAGVTLAQDSQPTTPAKPKADPGKYPSGEAKAESVQIDYRALQAGEARTETGTLDLEMEIEIPGQPIMTQEMTKTFKRTLTVREVDDKAKAVQVGVEFKKQSEVMEGSGPGGAKQRQERGKELEGKSFSVERQDDGTVVYSDEKGAPVEDFAAKRELEQSGRTLFGEFGLGAAVSKGELKPGQSVDIDPKSMKVLMEMPGDDGMEVSIEEFTYRGTRALEAGKAAVFKVVCKLEPTAEAPNRGPRTRMEIGGEVLISVEGGRVVGIDLAGTLEFMPPPAGGAGPTFEGKGILRVSRTTSVKLP